MNLTSGKFTAPRNGTYSFSFTRLVNPSSSSRVSLEVQMYFKGSNRIGSGVTDGQSESFSFPSTLNLQKGDELWLQIDSMSVGAHLYGYRYIQFSGWLLEENTSHSLNDM